MRLEIVNKLSCQAKVRRKRKHQARYSRRLTRVLREFDLIRFNIVEALFTVDVLFRQETRKIAPTEKRMSSTTCNTTHDQDKIRSQLVVVAVKNGLSWNRAELFPVAAQDLRTEFVLASTTEAKRPHDVIDLVLKNFCQLERKTIQLFITYPAD